MNKIIPIGIGITAVLILVMTVGFSDENSKPIPPVTQQDL